MNIIEKPVNFFKEVRTELTKVSWSTPRELMGATAVVMVVTAIMASFIFVIDIVLSKVLSGILR